MAADPGARTSDYDYDLPPARIAQYPNECRDHSRLMVVRRDTGEIEHGVFADLAAFIPAGDALVLNTTRVLRARLLGRRASGAPTEVLLLRAVDDAKRFEAMVHPGGKLRHGGVVHVAPELDVVIEERTDHQTRIVRLETALAAGEALNRFGHVPLPPYITRADVDLDTERYQTVYAKESGSIAAPTAGLHFTTDLLHHLEASGVRRVDILLHVGPGTFKPVAAENPADHFMHAEWFDAGEDATATLTDVRAAGRHVWAVGTTSARTLETIAGDDGTVRPRQGETRLFIRPPYRWRAVDRLITNFHLPRSTLLMLVAAFAGYELTMRAYRVALEHGYRFYSYGDAMVIL